MTGEATSDVARKLADALDAAKDALDTAKELNVILAERIAERTAELHESERRIRAIVDAAADAIITIDTKGIIQEFNGAAERMFGYTAEEIVGANVASLMPEPYREHHDEYLRNYLRTGEPRIIGKTRELRARRKDGRVFPIALSVSAVDHLGYFTGIIRDVTERKALQREILEIASREQRRIGEELHDGIQQELTGLGLLAQSLADALRKSSNDEAELAARLAKGISVANNHTRTLARGLIPVAVDAEGLMSALGELSEYTDVNSDLACSFECPKPVSMTDDVAATQLYRVAQEAVTNALKHAKAARVSIRLAQTDDAIRLEVEDDGVGIDEALKPERGNGLRIMQHRCEVIGGDLQIARSAAGGTAIVCVVPRP